MLISGVHFQFFYHQKMRNNKLGDYKKIYRQSQLRSGVIENKNKNEMLGTPYPPYPLGT